MGKKKRKLAEEGFAMGKAKEKSDMVRDLILLSLTTSSGSEVGEIQCDPDNGSLVLKGRGECSSDELTVVDGDGAEALRENLDAWIAGLEEVRDRIAPAPEA